MLQHSLDVLTGHAGKPLEDIVDARAAPLSARARYQTYAKATFKKDRRVNIRISGKDLEALQKRAVEEGLPYQTLIASLLHKYVSGRLVEKAA